MCLISPQPGKTNMVMNYPRPQATPTFQCCTRGSLKKWEWPGDEASYELLIKLSIILMKTFRTYFEFEVAICNYIGVN